VSDSQIHNPTPDADVVLTPVMPEVVTLSELFTLKRARKAWTAGLTAGVLAAGASVGAIFTDGKIESTEIVVVAGAFVVPFVGAFFAAWLPKND
jgi:hypothetical protein